MNSSDQQPLSSWQKFFKSILPAKLFADMENDSKAWKITCSNCNYEKSIWEIGGIRWKARGNPKVHRQCSNCGKSNWHQIVYKP